MGTDRFPDGDLGIVVYGSFFNRSDLEYLFGELGDRTARVRLRGYRRVFDARADRRDTVGDRSAVLNLHAGDAWCNGVLVTDLTPEEYGSYARRETTYRFELVDPDDVTYYEADADGPALPDEIIVPCDAPSHEDVRPIPRYVSTCLKGARQWGEDFYADFLETTYVAAGESLAEYLGVPARPVPE